MKSNPVGWFEIYVQDMARARMFYESVLQKKLEPMQAPEGDASGFEMLAFPGDPHGPGAGGMLVKMDGFAPGGGGTLVYFGCEDCAVQATRAEANGGGLVQGKMAIGEHGFCALERDTEGNVIGLHSMQ